MPNFATRIKELRESLPGNLSQLDFAKLLSAHYPEQMGKMTDRTISDWETGKSPPRYRNVILLAQFFDVSIDYLAGDPKRGRAPTIDEDDEPGPLAERSEASDEVALEGGARRAGLRSSRARRGSTRRPGS